ncbi:MAG: ribose 5-phosphate isomerase A [Longimicrobiales bacterium]
MALNGSAERGKEAAGIRAAEAVQPGMVLGLGTGSTVAYFLEALGRRVAAGELPGIIGVPTSRRTESIARSLAIPLTTLEEAKSLDLTVDGADEVAPNFDLIKGLGGALLREKMVAQATRHLVVIVDERKVVGRLGTRSPVPVEVATFGWKSHLPFLEELGARTSLREDPSGQPYRTDNGNLILDCRFPDGIPDPRALDRALADRAGVLESGLFLGLAREVWVGGSEGARALFLA